MGCKRQSAQRWVACIALLFFSNIGLANVDVGANDANEVRDFVEEYMNAIRALDSAPMKLKKLLSPEWLAKHKVDPLLARLYEPIQCHYHFGAGEMKVGRIGNDLLVDVSCRATIQGENVNILRLRLTRENGKLYLVPSMSKLSRAKIRPDWQRVSFDQNANLKSTCAEIGKIDDPKLQELAVRRFAEEIASRNRLPPDRRFAMPKTEFTHVSRKSMREYGIDTKVSQPNGYAWTQFEVIGVFGPYVDIKAWNDSWDGVFRLRTERVSDEGVGSETLRGYGILPASTMPHSDIDGERMQWVNFIWTKLDVVDNYLPPEQECAAFGYNLGSQDSRL